MSTPGPFPPDLWDSLLHWLSLVREGMEIPRIVLEVDPKTGQVTAIRPEVRVKHKRVC